MKLSFDGIYIFLETLEILALIPYFKYFSKILFYTNLLTISFRTGFYFVLLNSSFEIILSYH